MVRLKVLLICIVSQIVLTWRKIRSDMDMNIQEWIVRACWWICWAVAMDMEGTVHHCVDSFSHTLEIHILHP